MSRDFLSTMPAGRVGLVLSIAAILFAGSCKGKSSGGNAAPVDFAGFVRQQISSTSDDSEPVEVNGVEFKNQDTAGVEAFEPLFEP